MDLSTAGPQRVLRSSFASGWQAFLRFEPTDATLFGAARSRLMYRLLLFLCPLAWGAALVGLVAPTHWMMVVNPALFGVWLAMCLALARTGRTTAAALGLVFGSTGLLAVMLFPSGGLSGGVPLYFASVAMLAVILLERVPAAVMVALCAAPLLLAPLVEEWLAIEPVPLPSWGPLFTRALAMVDLVCLGGLTFDAFLAVQREADAQTFESLSAAARARAALEDKARFLGTMSHELRTPLNAILGYAGLLREETPEDPTLQRIEVVGGGLLALVEDLLELARAESVSIRPEPLDLGEMVRAELTGHGAWRLVAEGDLSMRGDPRAVTRVVRLLLKEAGGTIAVRAEPDRLVVSVPWASGEHDGQEAGLAVLVCERLVSRLGGTFASSSGGVLTVALPRSP